jgi:outer membrane immunogenic protein
MRQYVGWALASIVSLATGMIGAASAADLAARPYTKAPMMAPIMTYNWTGCYIGGNVGGGWARTNQSRVALVNGVAIVPPNDFGSGNGSNVIGGAQIGCDYQFAGNWVVGVQGMFDFGNISESHINPSFPTFSDNTKVKDVFTVTGRVGYLFAPQLLGYVKGGGAWARVDYNNFGTVPVNFLSESATGVDRQGWTVGGGLEWMFAPGWSVFGEFNYLDFGRKNISFVAAPGTVGVVADVVRTRLQVEQVLVGVNYKFNWGGPVVARY